MGSKVLLLLISAISLVLVSVSGMLHLVKINKTWSEAQSYCREHYTDLVSIRSAQEVEKINTTVQDVQTERVWIGLFRNNTSQQWQWSNGDYFMYLNWYQHALDSDLYAAAYRKQWLGRPSSSSLYFICQKVAERDSSAQKGYYLVNQMKSWTDAQQHCRDEGSEFASIRSPEEQEALNTLTDPFTADEAVWIGLYRENSSQPWKWSNGDPIEKWDSGEPDLSNTQDACVSMNGNAPGRALGFWDDRSCTERVYFLCYGGERRVLRIYITAPEGRDPEDPQIRDAILAEIQRSYSGHTPSQDLKLSWREIDGKIFHKQEDEEGGTCPKP